MLHSLAIVASLNQVSMEAEAVLHKKMDHLLIITELASQKSHFEDFGVAFCSLSIALPPRAITIANTMSRCISFIVLHRK